MLQQTNDDRVKALRITIKFNLAWCMENNNDIDRASETYLKIIEEEPTYTDAYLRLSLIARSRGDLSQSISYVDKAL